MEPSGRSLWSALETESMAKADVVRCGSCSSVFFFQLIYELMRSGLNLPNESLELDDKNMVYITWSVHVIL